MGIPYTDVLVCPQSRFIASLEYPAAPPSLLPVDGRGSGLFHWIYLCATLPVHGGLHDLLVADLIACHWYRGS